MYPTAFSDGFHRFSPLVVAFFFVVFLLPAVAFFRVVVREVVLFVLAAAGAFFVFPRVVPTVVFLTVVEARPFVDGVWDRSSVFPLVVTFLRVTRRLVAPSC